MLSTLNAAFSIKAFFLPQNSRSRWCEFAAPVGGLIRHDHVFFRETGEPF
jgi:hypothetical protein